MNLTSALHTALLLLPDRFSEQRLYMTLTGLSYAGDFRMTVGEDRNKIANIVGPALPYFRNLYSKRLEKMKQFLHKTENSKDYEQDVSPAGRHHHLTMLPKGVQMNLVNVSLSSEKYTVHYHTFKPRFSYGTRTEEIVIWRTY